MKILLANFAITPALTKLFMEGKFPVTFVLQPWNSFLHWYGTILYNTVEKISGYNIMYLYVTL